LNQLLTGQFIAANAGRKKSLQEISADNSEFLKQPRFSGVVFLEKILYFLKLVLKLKNKNKKQNEHK